MQNVTDVAGWSGGNTAALSRAVPSIAFARAVPGLAWLGGDFAVWSSLGQIERGQPA